MNQEQPTPPDLKVPANYMAVLRLYQAAAMQVLPNHFTQNCSINATRVAMMVLRSMGIELEPITVRVIVMNAAYRDLIERRELPDSPAWKEMGAHSVTAYDHLVGIYEEVILDSATGQFQRSDKDVLVDSVSILLFEGKRWPVKMVNSSETFMVYEPCTAPFKNHPGFQQSKSNMLAADNIVKLMRSLKHEKDARLEETKH